MRVLSVNPRPTPPVGDHGQIRVPARYRPADSAACREDSNLFQRPQRQLRRVVLGK